MQLRFGLIGLGHHGRRAVAPANGQAIRSRIRRGG